MTASPLVTTEQMREWANRIEAMFSPMSFTDRAYTRNMLVSAADQLDAWQSARSNSVSLLLAKDAALDALSARVVELQAALTAICGKSTSAPGYLHTVEINDARGLLMELSDIARAALAQRGGM